MEINSPLRAPAPSRAGARQRSDECAEPPRHARCDGSTRARGWKGRGGIWGNVDIYPTMVVCPVLKPSLP
jgi:hypothetical protein